jgi:AraC-like DNA-binding protein
MTRLFDADRLTFTTSLIEPKIRLRVFKRWMKAISEVKPSTESQLAASILVYRVGNVIAIRSASSPAHYRRRPYSKMVGPLDDFVLMRLVVRGHLYGAFDRNISQLAQGDIYLCDLSRRTDLWVGDVEHVNLLIPKGVLVGVEGKFHGPIGSCRSRSYGALLDGLTRLTDLTAESPRPEIQSIIDQVTRALVDYIKANRNLVALSCSLDESRSAIMHYVGNNLSSRTLSVGFLLNEFQMSRAKLFRLFSEFGGIHHYIRDQRLEAALRDICLHPSQQISAVAKRYGFSSSRQFQRAFRSRFGVSARCARDRWKIIGCLKISS